MHINVKFLTSTLLLAASIAAPVATSETGTPPQARQSIEALTTPKPAAPPRLEYGPNHVDETETLLQRKRQNRIKYNKDTTPLTPSPAEYRAQSLYDEATAQRPHAFLMELSLSLCFIQTTGKREGYTCNPTSHFNMAWRHNQTQALGKTSVWYGLRIAPFSGTGFYKKIPGSYGLTYFGPMLGVGKIDPLPRDAGSRRSGANPSLPTTSGWLLSTGIAGVSRFSHSQQLETKDNSDDFKAQSVDFDKPGFWAEGRYLHIFWGALSSNFMVGAQTGTGKTILYGGFGLGAWY